MFRTKLKRTNEIPQLGVELRIMTVGIVTDKCGSQLVFNTNPKMVLNLNRCLQLSDIKNIITNL